MGGGAAAEPDAITAVGMADTAESLVCNARADVLEDGVWEVEGTIGIGCVAAVVGPGTWIVNDVGAGASNVGNSVADALTADAWVTGAAMAGALRVEVLKVDDGAVDTLTAGG